MALERLECLSKSLKRRQRPSWVFGCPPIVILVSLVLAVDFILGCKVYISV